MRIKRSNNQSSNEHEKSHDIDCGLLEEEISNDGLGSQLNSLKGFDHHEDEGDYGQELAFHCRYLI